MSIENWNEIFFESSLIHLMVYFSILFNLKIAEHFMVRLTLELREKTQEKDAFSVL